ncbi:von Willebrand factor C and EGF domain-containing protein-like [Schistocerca cancellata]|uniref:von Willebrand factor C and EGF domain-containing protein-like n=1 Tax=Schistocerca cancellata TaxID=274614 RepID=UPI002118F4F5|nr:von Willebrand factor C and EGF domain-containing protein-like [Schistocerca cancellata]
MSARSGAVCAYVALLYILAVNGCPDNRIIRYYKELGCSPVPVNSHCPTSFDCGEWDKQDIKKCWLKGKQYNIGEDVRPLDEPCVHECSCRVDGKRAALSCITSECPEHLFDVELPKGCYHTHELDTCCASGELCANNGTELIRCHYEGKDYYEGQLLYNSSEPCKTCICDGEFKTKPRCREVSCGLELHWAIELQKGCAPIFYGSQTCCPIEWRCPRYGDRVIHRKTKKPSASVNSTGTVCHFGGIQLQIGEILVGRGEKRGSCQQCSCQLPPHVTCIQMSNCRSSPWSSTKTLDD